MRVYPSKNALAAE